MGAVTDVITEFAFQAVATLLGVLVALWADLRIHEGRTRKLVREQKVDLRELTQALANDVQGNIDAMETVRSGLTPYQQRVHATLLKTELWESSRVRLAELGASAHVLAGFAGFFHQVRRIRELLGFLDQHPRDGDLWNSIRSATFSAEQEGRQFLKGLS